MLGEPLWEPWGEPCTVRSAAVADTRVVDSRDTESGQAIRRRRECTSCGQRFTTFERIEGVPLVVLKRDGAREPFDRAKVVSGIAKACKNRPVSDEAMRGDLRRDRGDRARSAGARSPRTASATRCWTRL